MTIAVTIIVETIRFRGHWHVGWHHMTIAVMIIVETLLAQRVVQDVASLGTTIGIIIIMHGSGMALAQQLALCI